MLGVVLVMSASATVASRVEVITVPSRSMRDKKLHATVVLPDSYAESAKRYSVIYLLHGYSQDHRTWLRVAPLKEYAERYQCILVCPDGAYDSWYMDSPYDSDIRFETFLTRELPTHIDSIYRTFASYKGRALIGSSMGGHGAIYLLARNQDLFLGAGSISGIMDLTRFAGQFGIAKVLGPFDRHRDNWKRHSVLNSLDTLSGSQRVILLDCGLSDFALPGNRRAHEIMQKKHIPHEYYVRPGDHSPGYVARVAEYHILFFSRRLKKPGR
jgi:S-formylglutathione hydrolase FrmB